MCLDIELNNVYAWDVAVEVLSGGSVACVQTHKLHAPRVHKRLCDSISDSICDSISNSNFRPDTLYNRIHANIINSLELCMNALKMN